jgi:uncharacterized sulfatase
MNPELKQEIVTALSASGLLEPSGKPTAPSVGPVAGLKPNILFVMVDEMRFPSAFPEGVHDAAGFLKEFMPNVYRLWKRGVKFTNYNTAASACTPARGTIATGLYSQQTWVCCTLTNDPTAPPSPKDAPSLNPAFPTYGKLLREAGYDTPHIGKWHLSVLDKNQPGLGLEPYGFTGMVYPDPVGFNEQGTVGNEPDYRNDAYVANVASEWLKNNARSKKPWCLTVSFVNPHDKEFFWAGTEFLRYNALMRESNYNPFTYYSTASGNGAPPIPATKNVLGNPPTYGYPAIPPNWESAEQLAATKPSTQSVLRTLQASVWGGVSDDPKSTGFTVEPFPKSAREKHLNLNYGTGTAPFSYWSRSMDSYTQVQSIVDEKIGQVIDALPADVAENTVIVFIGDHGDYASAHGFVSGKIGTLYKEAYNVPLIVVDPSGRFTAETETLRDGLVSSVDLLRMLVDIGHNGRNDWMTGDLEQMYSERLDVLPLLKSAAAPGRDYLLLASDEVVPGYINYNNVPLHLVAVQTQAGKLGTYSHWIPLTDTIRKLSTEVELYDYSTPGGRLELDNIAGRIFTTLGVQTLFDYLVPNVLRAPLPGSLAEVSKHALTHYTLYEALVLVAPPPQGGKSEPPSHPFGGAF